VAGLFGMLSFVEHAQLLSSSSWLIVAVGGAGAGNGGGGGG
jgi:hypothetical protein